VAEAGKNPRGGAGAWAPVPPNSQSGESEAKMLVAWVLDRKKRVSTDAKRERPPSHACSVVAAEQPPSSVEIARNSLGDMLVSSRNLRPKCVLLLKPHESAISAMVRAA